MNYNDWWYRRAFILVPAQAAVGKMVESFKEYPPRQKPASFTVGQALEALQKSGTGGR
jgi:arylsulfatase